MRHCFRAQGATEYLVLLAVVLIVALVSVALLGFFPGMASDAQITQSKAYWQSASPIAITEWGAVYRSLWGAAAPYIRLKNNGVYPIRITKIIGGDGAASDTFYSAGWCGEAAWAYRPYSDYLYLGPGEETYLGWSPVVNSVCNREIYARTGTSAGAYWGGASSICQNSTSSPGMLQFNSFGFEYIEYLDNSQQITKRQIGKALIIKCMEAR